MTQCHSSLSTTIFIQICRLQKCALCYALLFASISGGCQQPPTSGHFTGTLTQVPLFDADGNEYQVAVLRVESGPKLPPANEALAKGGFVLADGKYRALLGSCMPLGSRIAVDGTVKDFYLYTPDGKKRLDAVGPTKHNSYPFEETGLRVLQWWPVSVAPQPVPATTAAAGS